MTMMDEYRATRQSQDAAYEDEVGLPIGDVERREYADYFDQHARVTLKSWLVDHRAEVAPAVTDSIDAVFMTIDRLARLAKAGDWVAADEIVRRVITEVGA